MNPEALTEALAANLFLQPTVVRYVVDYFLGSHTPLDEMSAGYQQTRLGELESDTRLLADALLAGPQDFELLVQVGVLGLEKGARPRAQCVYHWLGPAFAVPDTELTKAGLAELITAQATMCAMPETFWCNIVHGGISAHVRAHHFRFTRILEQLYRPAFMVAYMVALLVDKLVRCYDAKLLLVHGPDMLHAIGRAVQPRVGAKTRLDALDQDVLHTLAGILKNARDVSTVVAALGVLVKNIDSVLLDAHARLHAKSPLPEEADLETLMTLCYPEK